MARSAESILEDILQQLERGSGMQQLTAEEIARAMSMVDVNRKSSKGKKSSGLSDIADAASETASGLLKARNASEATGVLATGFKGLSTSILPGFGTAISLAADGAMKFYEYMNENLQMYQQLNTSGMQTTNGMMGLQKALATGRLNLDEYMSATADTRDVIASMGNDGAQQFSSMLNQVMKTEESLGSLNMSNEQMGKYLAANLKMQKSYGIFEKMNADQQNQSNIEYMSNLNKYSKSLGISTDALAKKLQDSADKVTGFGTQLALSQRGMDPKLAADSANNINSVMASFGGFGDAMNDQLARFIEFGQVDLDSEMGQLYQSNDDIRNLFEQAREMALDGSMATEAGAKQLQDMMANDGLVQSIDASMKSFRGAFGDTATNQIIQWRNQLTNYNADVNKVDAFWDNTMKEFNRTIESIFFSFKSGVADIFIDPQGFIKNIFGDKWGSWLLDGAFNWEVPDTPLVGSLSKFMDTFFEPVSWFWDALRGYGSGVSERFGSVEQPSWENIVRALMPDWLADIVLDGDQMTGDIANANTMSDNIDRLKEKYDKFHDEQLKALEPLWDNVTSELEKSAAESMKSMDAMYASVSDWWSKPSSQTIITKTITQTAKSTAPVALNIPESIEAKEPVPAMLEAIKALSNPGATEQLLEEIRRLNSNNEQQLSVLKKQSRGDNLQIN